MLIQKKHRYYHVQLEFKRTHTLSALSMQFQSTAHAEILHCSCCRSALHGLSSLSSLTGAEPELLLHTCITV